MMSGPKFGPLILLIVLAFAVSAWGAEKFVPVSRSDSEGYAYTTNGKVRIEIREIVTQSVDPNGRQALSVLVLFEPRSGAFAWRVDGGDEAFPSWRISELKSEHAAFLKGDEFVYFRPLGLTLFICTSKDRASSIDEAESKALEAARKTIDPAGTLESQYSHAIPLANLGMGFLIPPMESTGGMGAPQVKDLSWDGQHWHISLQGQWTAVVALNSKFELSSIDRPGAGL